MLFVLLLSPTLARAEATKEIYSDFGLYISSMNIFIFPSPPDPNESVDANFIGEPGTPEGQKAIITNLTTSGWGIFNVDVPNSFNAVGRDYSEYFGGAIRFWIKSNTPVLLKLQLAGREDPAAFVPGTGGVWKEAVIPLTNFTSSPSGLVTAAQLIQTRSPFEMFSAVPGINRVAIDHIRWTKPLQTIVAFPAATSALIGNRREFVAEGRSAANEFVDVYPTWNVTGAGNSLSPGAPAASRYTILTMGAPGGTVTMLADGIGGSAAATVAGSSPSPFGIVSETLAGLNLDADSKLLANSGGAGSSAVADDITTFQEGAKSTRADVTLVTAGDSAGWFVQWGLAGSPDSIVKDMSAYYDGSIRFWFKAPPALQNFMQVGLRSGNVAAGSELSKVALAPFAPCDNNWHAVTIPLAALSKAAPWADLSRTKVFFEIFAVSTSGGTGGPQSFWVDNVRWDPTAPGPLASLTVSPAFPIAIPPGAKRIFTVQGFDASGFPIDVLADWSMSPNLGTLSAPQGSKVILTAQATPVSGTLTASSGTITASVTVNVAAVVFTQSYNVFSDAGAGGTIGVSGFSLGSPPNGNMTLLNTPLGGSAPGTTNYMHAAWTMVNTAGLSDAFAVWFVAENNGARFMDPYKNGFLQFWVRSTTDLQVSLRSANIPAGTERCKFRLSALGIPLDGNWQQVTLSLADFQTAEPALDFTQIAVYFTIGVLSNQIGPGSGTFDVANAQWLTASTSAIAPAKVYAGLKGKQNPTTGLVLSFDNDASLQAVTYDQALAAMNYTYQGDRALAEKVFNTYQTLNPGNGFFDGYNRDTRTVLPTMNTRSVGPNAWILLALLHYRSATGGAAYDPMINSLAAWLLARQTNAVPADGGVDFGFNAAGAELTQQKSTEQNFDCYAAFKAYYAMTGNAAYLTAANNIAVWLAATAWNSGLRRFNVGVGPTGILNTDKALDTYSWAPLATSSYTAVLAVAKTDFENTKPADLTGFSVDGFDMGGVVGVQPTYTDAVWLEGTAQMAEAYWFVQDQANANHFINEIEKAILATSPTTQGLAYATNGGTGFGGFPMDSLHPAVSSMAWYLFAKNQFNPFRSFPILSVPVRKVSDNTVFPSITWSGAVAGASWIRADQYLDLSLNPGVGVWGVQIYTDNTAADAIPLFVSAVPPGQPGSNPGGMIGQCNPSTTLSMAWSVLADTTAPPATGDPNTNRVWSFVQDRLTPDIAAQNTTHFADGAPFVVVKNNQGIQASQGTFVPALTPSNPIYLEANFSTALGGCSYKTTTLRVEYFYP